MIRQTFLSVAVIVAATTLQAPSNAQEAEPLLSAGWTAFRAQQWNDCIKLFERGLKVGVQEQSQHDRALFVLAQCHEGRAGPEDAAVAEYYYKIIERGALDKDVRGQASAKLVLLEDRAKAARLVSAQRVETLLGKYECTWLRSRIIRRPNRDNCMLVGNWSALGRGEVYIYESLLWFDATRVASVTSEGGGAACPATSSVGYGEHTASGNLSYVMTKIEYGKTYDGDARKWRDMQEFARFGDKAFPMGEPGGAKQFAMDIVVTSDKEFSGTDGHGDAFICRRP